MKKFPNKYLRYTYVISTVFLYLYSHASQEHSPYLPTEHTNRIIKNLQNAVDLNDTVLINRFLSTNVWKNTCIYSESQIKQLSLILDTIYISSLTGAISILPSNISMGIPAIKIECMINPHLLMFINNKNFPKLQLLKIKKTFLLQHLEWKSIIKNLPREIEKVSFSHTNLDAISLCNIKQENFPKLKHLCIHHNTTIPTSDWRWLIESFPNQIERLSLKGTTIDYTSIDRIYTTFASGLEELNLSYSKYVHPSKWKAILQSLPSTLSTLKLSGNSLKGEDLYPLYPETLPYLKTVSLKDCSNIPIDDIRILNLKFDNQISIDF